MSWNKAARHYLPVTARPAMAALRKPSGSPHFLQASADFKASSAICRGFVLRILSASAQELGLSSWRNAHVRPSTDPGQALQTGRIDELNFFDINKLYG